MILWKVVLIALTLLMFSCANTQKIESERVIASTWMPVTDSDEDTQLAGAFGLALAHWVDKYDNLRELPNGEFIPTFSSLNFAFQSQLSYWFKLSPESRSSVQYMRAIQKVKDADFLSEYIWFYHSHPSWGKPTSTLKLNEFKKWSISNLHGHQPRIESKIDVISK